MQRGALKRAMTLLELTIVIVIIAIVSTMAVPRYADAMVRQRVSAAARRLAADLNLARREARVAGASRTIKLDLTRDSYVVDGMSDPDHPSRVYVVDLSVAPYEADLLSTTLGEDATLTYDAYGLPDRGGSIILRVGGEYASVTVNAACGEAQAP